MFVGIIVAAGSGNRMSSKQKKQYIDVQGKPLLYYSLRAFQDSSVDEIILVTSADEIEYCQKEIIEKYKMTKVTKVVAGGEERYESVYEGLKVTNPDSYVLIHDGARPMISVELIERIMKAVVKYKACIAAVPVKDTIKKNQYGWTSCRNSCAKCVTGDSNTSGISSETSSRSIWVYVFHITCFK